MLSTIGLISALLIVFTVGFAVGRKPLEPININLKVTEFSVEDLELCRNIFKSVADCIDDALVDVEDEEELDSSEDVEEALASLGEEVKSFAEEGNKNE